jgi:SAM-dependent methyltransferase
MSEFTSYPTTTINPFFAARGQRLSPRQQKRVYAELPAAPQNASPVPHLTSLYHFNDDGRHRDSKYPGNCGGNLIRDLLSYFKPEGPVFDPMSGSGTCRDVCDDLGLPCVAADIHQDFDACEPSHFTALGSFDFIWAHPPYFRQKLYATDSRDLSRAPSLEAFLERYGQFFRNCAQVLRPGGKLVVLMGDYCDRQEGFVPLVYHSKRLAIAAGLRQCCTDIIRFSHGSSSSKKVYHTSFIPGLHDVCMIFEKSG